MDGVHDLGGMEGFGTVEVEANEPTFHHAWERTVFALAAAISAQRLSNTHVFRHAIERMDPVHYLSSPYYEHWLTGIATSLIERGLFDPAALEAKAGGAFPLSRPMHGDRPAAVPSGPTPRFAVGDDVQVRNLHPHGHTRCPRYVRGRRGVVARVDGRFPLPDISAHGGERCKQFSYNVRFAARDLWDDASGGHQAVYVDLWESYLDQP